jgi:hypothetical protein
MEFHNLLIGILVDRQHWMDIVHVKYMMENFDINHYDNWNNHVFDSLELKGLVVFTSIKISLYYRLYTKSNDDFSFLSSTYEISIIINKDISIWRYHRN